jgi:CHASE3 domain sensor protein
MRSLTILTACSWCVLLLCAVILLFIGIAVPSFVSESIIKNREKRVQEIRASTNLAEIQDIAAWRTQREADFTVAARAQSVVSAVTLLLCMICSGVSLHQIRRLRRELHDSKIAA